MKTRRLIFLVFTYFITSYNANAQVKVSTKGGLKISSGEYKFQLGGRIMYDYNRAEKNNIVDEDGIDLRRGRVFLKGDLGDNWSFKSQFNIDGDGVEDLYIRYKGWGKVAQLTIGNQKMPFILEDQQSSKDISILERSAITERFSIGRGEGVTVAGTLLKNQWYSVGLYTEEVNEKDSGEELGFAVRYAFAPINTSNKIVHFGIAYRDIDESNALGLEAATSIGPWHLQAEYLNGEIDAENIDGYYIQAGYILTGETRPYKKGVFKRVKPSAKTGAWELVARYEDGDGNFSDTELGATSASAYSIGVNWYAHNNVRFGVNYTEARSDNSMDEGSEFRIRFQLTF